MAAGRKEPGAGKPGAKRRRRPAPDAPSAPAGRPAGRPAATAADLLALKRLVSERVRGIAGVSGIGLAEDALKVYLETDSDDIRSAVRAAVDESARDAPLRFEVTGTFRAL